MEAGQIVISSAGHDRGGIFYVVKGENDYLFLVDGKRRSVSSPKRKKKKHLRFAACGGDATAAKLRNGESVTDREIRRSLAAFRDSLGAL